MESGIVKSFARTMQIFAKGTTNPGIKFFNLFQCFKSINNLCLNFSPIITQSRQYLAKRWLFAAQETATHTSIFATTRVTSVQQQKQKLQQDSKSWSNFILVWFGRKREIDAMTMTNTRNNFWNTSNSFDKYLWQLCQIPAIVTTLVWFGKRALSEWP